MSKVDMFQELHHKIQESPEMVEQEAQKLLVRFIESKDLDKQFKCYLLLSNVHSHLGNYQMARNVLKPAEKIAADQKDLQKLAKVSNHKGTIHWYQGNYPQALDEYVYLKQLAEKLDDKKLLFNA